ncbi:unnamed protein product [Staurois parvus]|uniref:G-protein coupled receptors family 1 profile domain-containing protein n=1 Tax=Staurois parvus TaxID=386267 RepID=A0ABN9EKY0_9NEOB|nr:unnamed protein product [Staurois parvus]
MNETIVAEVLILGFDGFNEYRIPLFLLLLVIYTLTCIENLLMISVIWKSPRLHSPMYFLISNLLFCEFVGTTGIDPSVMQNILWGRSVVPFVDCVIQMHVVIAILVFETFLLTLMSYDRYLAICQPLRYSALMHNRLCLYLIISFWLFSAMVVAVSFYFFMSLKFCAPVIIYYFFCECTAFSVKWCVISNTKPLYIFGWVITYLLNLPFAFIVLSYLLIIISILRIKTSARRQKAFSTCSSHLVVVTLYFGIPFATYMH